MKIESMLVAAVLLASACIAQGQSDKCPTTTGAYYFSQEKWNPMEIAHSSGFKISGLYTHTVKAAFRDSAAPYQSSQSTLRFCLVQLIDSGRDLNLAKLEVTKKEREIQFGKAGLSGFKMEINPKSLVSLKVEKQAEKVYLISSDGPVKEGEYILLPILPNMATASNQATNLSGYDIGLHSK